MDFFSIARHNMVHGQVLPSEVTDIEIINLMADLPRHLFVPDNYRDISYSDGIVPLNKIRDMLPPVILARMLQALKITPDDVALDIACGSGYSSIMLSNLAKKVIAIESCSDLASKASAMINKHNIGNVIILNGDLSVGHPDGSPYDIIFVNGALALPPYDLFDQLADGGRLVTIINKSGCSGSAVLYQKNDGKIVRSDMFDAMVDTLEDFETELGHAQ